MVNLNYQWHEKNKDNFYKNNIKVKENKNKGFYIQHFICINFIIGLQLVYMLVGLKQNLDIAVVWITDVENWGKIKVEIEIDRKLKGSLL